MLAALFRKRGISACLLLLGVAASCHAVAQEALAPGDALPERSSVSEREQSSAAPVVKSPAPGDERQDGPDVPGPTDDFGRPLSGCDVPWDLVPDK
jgi:hypothetical protein